MGIKLTPEEHYVLHRLSGGIQPMGSSLRGTDMTYAEVLAALKKRGLVDQGYYVTQMGHLVLRD